MVIVIPIGWSVDILNLHRNFKIYGDIGHIVVFRYQMDIFYNFNTFQFLCSFETIEKLFSN